MKGDLSVVGVQTELPIRVAASATRWQVGEPMHNLASWTSGAASVNTFVVAAADTPVIGTHTFGGVAIKAALPYVGVGTVPTIVAQTSIVARPISDLGRLRGKAETAANIDTDAELLAIILDLVLIDYNATGGVGSTPLYTIKDSASANTSGLQIIDGNIAKGTLDVIVDPRAYRSTVS